MGRPRGQTLSVKFNVLIAPELERRLSVQARRLGLSTSAYLRVAATRQLEADERDEAEAEARSARQTAVR